MPPMFWLAWISLCSVCVAAVSLDLCSPVNLGTDRSYSEYMSNGLCKTTCSGYGYAVAITQNYYCWCSNDVPEDTVLLSECDTGCPGYSQEEDCGGDGVYGYVILLQPLSTVGELSTSTLPLTLLTLTLPLASSLTLSRSSSLSLLLTVEPLSAELTTSSSSRSSSRRSSLAQSTSSDDASDSNTTSDSSLPLPLPLATSSASAALLLLVAPSTTLDETSSSLAAATTAVRATTVISVTTVNGLASQLVLTKYVTEVASSSSSTTTHKLSLLDFFDSTAKVAGTFTAVGVVVVAIVAGILYYCCFAGGRRHNDDYSDEENQYSSDDMSLGNEKEAPMRDLKPSLRGLSGLLNRNNLSKLILSMFNAMGAGAGGAAVARSALKKRLNPKHEELPGMMFPISEFDHRLDPATMFQTNNESKMSLADEQDYSRRILHIANPES